MNETDIRMHQKSCLRCHFLATTNSNQQTISVPPSERQKLESAQDIKFDVNFLHSYTCFRQVWMPAQEIDEVIEDCLSEAGKSPNYPNVTDSEKLSVVASAAGESRDYERIIMDRADKCFFYPYMQRMSLEAAAELECRESNRREANRDRRWAKIGVWVAAIALVLNLAWSIYQHFNSPGIASQKAMVSQTQSVRPSYR